MRGSLVQIWVRAQFFFYPTLGELTPRSGMASSAVRRVARRCEDDAPIPWHELLCWDATDNALQALRFSLLLLHVHARAPPPTTAWEAIRNPTGYAFVRLSSLRGRKRIRHGLLVATEGVANVRRLVLVSWWVYTLGKECRVRSQRGAQDVAPHRALDSLAQVGECLAHVGESFDVASFLQGSGLFWRALGMSAVADLPPWLQRRRRGLERVGVFVSLLALIIQLYVEHQRRKRILRSMMHHVQSMQREVRRIDNERSAAQQIVPQARERVEEAYACLVTERRRLRWLGVERLCLWGDMSFTLTEAWAPSHDHELLEAGTGLVAAVLRILRLWNEVRFGALDI